MLMGKTQEKEERGDVAELGERGGDSCSREQEAGSSVDSMRGEKKAHRGNGASGPGCVACMQ